MTSYQGPMTDSQLEQILSAWFDEGAPTAPDRIAENALAQVATVPQERDWPQVLRTSFSGTPVAWGAGILAMAIGIGILIGPSLIGGPSPGPEPSPDPSPSFAASPTPAGLNVYVNSEAGYEVLVPRGWEEIQPQSFAGRHPGVAAFGHPWDGAILMTISAETADGAFSVCDFTCEPVVTDSLDEVQEALAISETVQSWSGSGFEEVPVALTVEDVMLGGVAGRMVRYDPEREGVAPPFNYAFAFVRDRPVLFGIAAHRPWGMVGDPVTEVLDQDQLQAILDSFRFVGAATAPSPDGETSAPDLGRAVWSMASPLPTGWRQLADSPPGVSLFRGVAGTASITVGSPAGQVTTCPESSGPWEVCRQVSVGTIDELMDAIEPRGAVEHGIPVPGPVTRGSFDLDGIVANRISIESYEYPARGAEHVTYLLALHDGRPVVLRFHTTRETPREGWIDEFVHGFRWATPPEN
jgi:hypothetical protein